ncbi:MAG: hypothetical protein HY319_13240 [Armatimonadetes bacterium]|nr:hypothetical protein [Armatimonadota bacterium]
MQVRTNPPLILSPSPSPAPAEAPQPEEARDSFTKAVTTVAYVSGGGTLGYLAGALAGSGLEQIGATAKYLTYGPVMGASMGACWGLLRYKQDDNALTQVVRGVASTGSGLSIGICAGDLLGLSMQALGQPASYASFGAAAGGATGALAGLAIQRWKDNDLPSVLVKGAASTVGGGTTGWFVGGGLSTMVGYLTNGSHALSWAPLLFGVAGGLAGLAAYIIQSDGVKPAPPEGQA